MEQPASGQVAMLRDEMLKPGSTGHGLRRRADGAESSTAGIAVDVDEGEATWGTDYFLLGGVFRVWKEEVFMAFLHVFGIISMCCYFNLHG